MISRRHILFTLLAAALLAGCGVSRRIPRGEYLLRRNVVKIDRQAPRQERLTASELTRYVQQTPGSWNSFLRRRGEGLSIWDESATTRTEDFLETFVRSRGFFGGSVETRVDSTKRRRVRVRHLVRQGRPSRLGRIEWAFRDSLLAPRIDTAGTLLRKGAIFNTETLDAERARIAGRLRDEGYFDFNVSHISFVADTLREPKTVDIQAVIRPNLINYSTSGEPRYAPHRTYRIDSVMVENAPKIRPKVLERAIKITPGELYSADATARTSRELMRLGIFRTAVISFAKKDTLLDARIRLTPAFRQGFGLDVEGSTTSSFYGLRTTLRYLNRNAFRGAELLEASLTGGFEFLKSSERRLSYELGGAVSVTFPRSSTISLSANWQDRAYYTRALLALNWGTTWTLRNWQNLTVRPLDINLISVGHLSDTFREQLNNPYLVASYADQLVAGLSASWVYNNQPRNLSAGAVVARVNFETTGNLLSAFTDRIFGIQFSQYVRGDASFSHTVRLGGRTAIAYRVQAGAVYSYGNSVSPPFEKLFFAGGVNSMRGWAVRTLGPGTVPYKKQNYPAQMGDVKLEANAEMRFPMAGAWRGALFFDLGNVWFMRSRPAEYPDEAVFRLGRFYRQLGFNTGLGVRVDVRFVVLRLDWGVQLHNPGRTPSERWISRFRWRDTALNFGVGYPF